MQSEILYYTDSGNRPCRPNVSLKLGVGLLRLDLAPFLH